VLEGGRDVNLEQVRAGLAWHYKYYQDEQSPADRRLYADAETEARSAGRGLWADPDPTPPWDFRHGGRSSARPSPTQAATKPWTAQTPDPGQGNLEARVWVNTNSGVYHCPGTRWYGRTKEGEFMNQREARGKGFRPAYGSVCR
jgi:hypothetical protein